MQTLKSHEPFQLQDYFNINDILKQNYLGFNLLG